MAQKSFFITTDSYGIRKMVCGKRKKILESCDIKMTEIFAFMIKVS